MNIELIKEKLREIKDSCSGDNMESAWDDPLSFCESIVEVADDIMEELNTEPVTTLEAIKFNKFVYLENRKVFVNIDAIRSIEASNDIWYLSFHDPTISIRGSDIETLREAIA